MDTSLLNMRIKFFAANRVLPSCAGNRCKSYLYKVQTLVITLGTLSINCLFVRDDLISRWHITSHDLLTALRFKHQRRPIDAEPFSRLERCSAHKPPAIIKHIANMTSARTTSYLRRATSHWYLHRILHYGGGETRPPRAAFEFVQAGEQRCGASRADIRTGALL